MERIESEGVTDMDLIVNRLKKIQIEMRLIRTEAQIDNGWKRENKNPKAFVLLGGKQHCYKWRETGKCKFGNECKYAHDPPTVSKTGTDPNQGKANPKIPNNNTQKAKTNPK